MNALKRPQSNYKPVFAGKVRCGVAFGSALLFVFYPLRLTQGEKTRGGRKKGEHRVCSMSRWLGFSCHSLESTERSY